MNIIISNSSNRPIYEQITDQIKAMIMNGQLQEGDALASMRLLAKELRISVITTKRAYEELEKDGFIESVMGKGSFVSRKNIEFIKEEQLRIIESNMEKIVEVAKVCDISFEELVKMLSLVYKGE